jgi:methyl-accepting chemotaxis protein
MDQDATRVAAGAWHRSGSPVERSSEMNLKNLPVVHRLNLILVIAFLGALTLAAIALFEFRAQMRADYARSIRSLVQTAHGTLEHFHALEKSGAMSASDAQDAAKAALRAIRYDGTEYFYIYDTRGFGVMHPIRGEFEGQNMIGKVRYRGERDLIGDIVGAVRTAPEAYLHTEFPRPGTKEPVSKLQFLKRFEPWGWIIGSGIYVDDIDAAFRAHLLYFGSVVLAVMGLLMFVAWRVVRSITAQLGGEPARAAEVMRRVADGDLQVSVEGFGDRTDNLLGALVKMLAQLREMMRGIGDNAARAADNSREISAVSRQVAEAAHGQSDATSAIASAVEQMTVSIDHVSGSACETGQNSSQAARLAQQGEERSGAAASEMIRIAAIVDLAAERIRQIVTRANEIGSIASAIREIAAQTNLLALNAAIEAARAGEQGRGFAMVADEVRGLAERTAAATVQIEQTIKSIQADTHGAVDEMSRVAEQVKKGVGLVDGVAGSLRDIRGGTDPALGQIREVADATKEQGATSTSIARQVEQIAERVEGTSASIRSAVSAVEELERLASDLREMIAKFRY